jgi:RHS repeat-associated protein
LIAFTVLPLSKFGYHPGGMMMPGRKYQAGSGYRYGFNGKELDKEGPVQYDYGFRIYNPALGRFLSVDPLTYSYPYYTPYQFAGNMPIAAIDLDGLEQYVVTYYKDQNSKVTKIEVRAVFENSDMSTPLNQKVHKIGTTEDIAKGNVLVFEIKKEKNGKESMEIVDRKDNNNLTKDEAKIFKKTKANLELEKGEEQSLEYGTDKPKQLLYSSKSFDNSKTKTFSSEYGIVPPLPLLEKPKTPVEKNEKKVVEVEIFTVHSQGSVQAKNDVESLQWMFSRGGGQAILKENKADEVKLMPKIHYNAKLGSSTNGMNGSLSGETKVTKIYTVPKQ